jgi:two-component system, OmpR family, response regulator
MQGFMDTGRQSGTTRSGRSAAEASIPRIAVVDDDARVRRLLRNVFEEAGYRVSEAGGEAELMAALKRHNISLITLDLNLRHEDGLAIARAVRRESDVAIIMVTARTDDADRIAGLEIGADDYITKPFNVREVLARVRAVLRRTHGQTGNAPQPGGDVLRFNGYVLDVAARELRTATGRNVPLTGAEFNLLAVLASHPGRVLSRESLLDFTSGGSAEPLERSIDTIVGRLRKKIDGGSNAPHLIKTVRGAGYIFTVKPQRSAG